MRTERGGGWLGLALLALTSCATVDEPSPAVPAELLPAKLEVTSIGTPLLYTEKTVLENGRIIESVTDAIAGDGKEVTKTRAWTPTAAQWHRFWAEMERINIWVWKPSYNPSDVGEVIMDGGGWELHLERNGRSIKTGGWNAGPKEGNPGQTVAIGMDEEMMSPDEALAILQEGKGRKVKRRQPANEYEN